MKKEKRLRCYRLSNETHEMIMNIYLELKKTNKKITIDDALRIVLLSAKEKIDVVIQLIKEICSRVKAQ